MAIGAEAFRQIVWRAGEISRVVSVLPEDAKQLAKFHFPGFMQPTRFGAKTDSRSNPSSPRDENFFTEAKQWWSMLSGWQRTSRIAVGLVGVAAIGVISIPLIAWGAIPVVLISAASSAVSVTVTHLVSAHGIKRQLDLDELDPLVELARNLQPSTNVHDNFERVRVVPAEVELLAEHPARVVPWGKRANPVPRDEGGSVTRPPSHLAHESGRSSKTKTAGRAILRCARALLPRQGMKFNRYEDAAHSVRARAALISLIGVVGVVAATLASPALIPAGLAFAISAGVIGKVVADAVSYAGQCYLDSEGKEMMHFGRGQLPGTAISEMCGLAKVVGDVRSLGREELVGLARAKFWEDRGVQQAVAKCFGPSAILGTGLGGVGFSSPPSIHDDRTGLTSRQNSDIALA